MPLTIIHNPSLSGLKQYENHLDKQIYLKNLKRSTKDVTDYLLLDIQNTLVQNQVLDNRYNEDNLAAIEKLSLGVNGSLQEGFTQLSDDLIDGFNELGGILYDIGSNIDSLQDEMKNVGRCLVELGSLLDWKTDLIIQCQQTTNKYLDELIETSKLSDSEKKKMEHTYRTGKLLNNAMKEGADSESFTRALYYLEEIDKIDPYDFISHYRKGIIHLKSKASLDIDAAIKNFIKSVDYSQEMINTSFKGVDKEICEEIIRTAYYYLSECAHIKENFFESLKYAEKAYRMMPSNPDFCLQVAKMHCVNMNEEEAGEYVMQAILLDPTYADKALRDMDLNSKKIITDLIENECITLIKNIGELLNELGKYTIPETIENQEKTSLIEEFQTRSYVAARKIGQKINDSNLVERVNKSNASFFEACRTFEKNRKDLIDSLINGSHEHPNSIEKDYKSEVKMLGYAPSNGRYYFEKDLVHGKTIACAVDNDDKVKNLQVIGAIRVTIPITRKLEIFDFIWYEWINEYENSSNRFIPICEIRKPGHSNKSLLVIKRNLNQYFIYGMKHFGFSTGVISLDGYFVELGFSFFLRVTDPVAIFKRFPGVSFATAIANRISDRVKQNLTNKSFRELSILYELRNEIKNGINAESEINEEGFKIEGLYSEGYVRYTFKNYRLEPVNL